MRKLKIWNGRGHGRIYQNGHFYVAAYTQKQAAELVGQAAGSSTSIGLYEIRNYYSDCWGTQMNGITPTEPCVYAAVGHFEKPIKISK